MNAGTLIVLLIVVLVTGMVVYGMVKGSRSGKGGCPAGCDTCSVSDAPKKNVPIIDLKRAGKT